MLSLLKLPKRIISSFLCISFLNLNSSVLASNITVNTNNSLPTTNTSVINNNNVFNITTQTTTAGGTVGINSFSRFDLSQGHTANLYLINNQNKLVNLIFDNKASSVDGIVNSYINGSIGGNVVFANPNGFIIGENGVFNTGVLTLMTPTKDTMVNLFSKNNMGWVPKKNFDGLITFTIKDDKLKLHHGVELSRAPIYIKGKINSKSGISLISGSGVSIEKSAELNANSDGKISPSKINKTNPASNPKDIVIAANNAADASYDDAVLGAIVNLDGKIKTNGANLFVRAQSQNPSSVKKENLEIQKNNGAAAGIKVGKNANIDSYDVSIKSNVDVSGFVKGIKETLSNVVGLKEFNSLFHVLDTIPSVAHVEKSVSRVDIESGAVISAINSTVISAQTKLNLENVKKSGSQDSILNLNVFVVDSTNEATIRNDAVIKAADLELSAFTKSDLKGTTQADALPTDISGKKLGTAALSFTFDNLVNNATIEKNANISDVKNNLDISATTARTIKNSTSNGGVHELDNHGAAGASFSFINSKVDNNAVLYANASVDKKLEVKANYTGTQSASATANAGGSGSSNKFGQYQEVFERVFGSLINLDAIHKLFSDIDPDFTKNAITGAVNVSIENTLSKAIIGNKEAGIKPIIEASEVYINSSLTDKDSRVSASSSASNSKLAIGGSVALNYRDLTSDSEGYGAFTIKKGSPKLVISSKTEINQPRLDFGKWLEQMRQFSSGEALEKAVENIEKEWAEVDKNDADAYSKQLNDIIRKNLGTLIPSEPLEFIVSLLNSDGHHNLDTYFNTIATSSAGAKSTGTETAKGFDGALAVALQNTNAFSRLVDESSIEAEESIKPNIDISSSALNNMWTAGLIYNLNLDTENLKNLLAAINVNGGSAVGFEGAFAYSDSKVLSEIGKNIDYKVSELSDVNVSAKENGDFVTLAIGSASADKSGYGGAFGFSVFDKGYTKAIVNSNNSDNNKLRAKRLNIDASKNDHIINVVLSASQANRVLGSAVSFILANDAVEAYLASGVIASEIVGVTANYDKVLVNSNISLGTVKNEKSVSADGSEDAPKSVTRSDFDPTKELEESGGPLSRIEELHEDRSVQGKLSEVSESLGKTVDTKAGSIGLAKKPSSSKNLAVNLNLTKTKTSAAISDVAVVKSKDVKVDAKTNDVVVTTNSSTALKGEKSGALSALGDISVNKTSALVNNSSVVANNLSVKASEDYKLIQANAGVSSASESSGTGSVGLAVEANEVNALITADKDKRSDVSSDKISVLAENKNFATGVIGGFSVELPKNNDAVQSASSKGAGGQTISGNIAINSLKAGVENSGISSKDSVDINAYNKQDVIDVDIAGTYSKDNKAYAGSSGAYVGVNSVDAYVKNSEFKSRDLEQKPGKLNIKADDSFFETAIIGTVAVADKNVIGLTTRTDILIDNINSYIENSQIQARETNLTNSANVNQVSVALSGSGETNTAVSELEDTDASDLTLAGVLNIFVDVSHHNNYVKDSTLNVAGLDLDTKKDMKNLTVTGAVAASASKNGDYAVGESAYALGVGQEFNTYISNSTVKAAPLDDSAPKPENQDVKVNSTFKHKILDIVFGGSGGKGLATSGAIAVLANHLKNNSYITKSDILQPYGKVSVLADNEINALTIDGNINVSSADKLSAGGAVNTAIYKSNVAASISDSKVAAKNGVDVQANSKGTHFETVVGASGGGGTSIQGSIDSFIMSQDVSSGILRTDIKTDGDLIVISDDTLSLTSLTGAVEASTKSSSFGGAILTAVINGSVASSISDVNLLSYSKDANIGVLKVNATQKDSFLGAGIGAAVSGSSNTIDGSIETIVINKKIDAVVNKLSLKKDDTESQLSAVDILADSQSEFHHNIGALSTSGNSNAIGAGVQTQVVNKKINSAVSSSDIKSLDNISNKANSKIYTSSIVAGIAASGNNAVNAVAVTDVYNIDAASKVDNSNLDTKSNVINEATVRKTTASDDNPTLAMILVSGGKAAAVGAGVYSYVDNSKANALIEKTEVKGAKGLTNNAVVDLFDNNVIVRIGGAKNASAGALAATNVVNALANSSVDGLSALDNTYISVTSENNFETKTYSISPNASSSASVGAIVGTYVFTKSALASVINSHIKANDGVIVSAISDEYIDDALVSAGASGNTAIEGAMDTIVSNNKVDAKIENSNITVNNNKKEKVKLLVSANDNLFLSSKLIYAALSSTTSVGAGVVTGVVNNYITAAILDTNITAKNTEISVYAHEEQEFGTKKNPLLTIGVAGGSTAGIGGSVDTLVFSSKINSNIKAKKDSAQIDAKDSEISATADSNTSVFLVSGSAEGSGNTSVGAGVSTNVVNKSISSYIENIKIDSNELSVLANSYDSYFVTADGGAFSGTAAVQGAVITNVFNSSLLSNISKSNIKANKVELKAIANSNLQDVAVNVSASGYAGVGGTVITNVIKNNLIAYLSKDTNITDYNSLAINSDAETSLESKLGCGTAALAGASVGATVLTNVISNNVEAYSLAHLNGDEENFSHSSKVEISAQDSTTLNSNGGSVSGALYAAAGASVFTNVISSNVAAYIGGLIENAGNISVEANSIQNFVHTMAFAAGAGIGDVSASVLTNTINSQVLAYSLDDTQILNSNKLILGANNNTTFNNFKIVTAPVGLITVGGAVVVNNISNTVKSFVGKNNRLTLADTIDIKAASNNHIGNENDKLKVIAFQAIGAGMIGTVLVNNINDYVLAEIGNNSDIRDTKKINVHSDTQTTIAENLSAQSVNLASVGATVGINTIKSTSIARVGSSIEITGKEDGEGKIDIAANSKETIIADISAGNKSASGMNGGILKNTIGESSKNSNVLSNVNKKEYIEMTDNAREKQEDALKKKNNTMQSLNKLFNDNLLSNRKKNSVTTLHSAVKTNSAKEITNNLKTGLKSYTDNETNKYIAVDDIVKNTDTTGFSDKIANLDINLSTDTKNNKLQESYSDKNSETAAFIDSNTVIKNYATDVKANNQNNIVSNMNMQSYSAGIGAGDTLLASDVLSKVDAFIADNVEIENKKSQGVNVTASSGDTQQYDSNSSAYGIGRTSSLSSIIAYSEKDVSAYILNNSSIDTAGDVSIATNTKKNINSTAKSATISAVASPEIKSYSIDKSASSAYLADGVKLAGDSISIVSNDETTLKTQSASSKSGGVIGASSIVAKNYISEDDDRRISSVSTKIGKNSKLAAKINVIIVAASDNTLRADSNGSLGGVISNPAFDAVNQLSKKVEVDINEGSSIKGYGVEVKSNINNKLNAKTSAGSNGLIANSSPTPINNVKESVSSTNISNNTTIEAEHGGFTQESKANNVYNTSNKLKLGGAIAINTLEAKNSVNSDVSSISNADILTSSGGSIDITAFNKILKTKSNDFDVDLDTAGLGTGNNSEINDRIVANTKAELNGNSAIVKNGSGHINVKATTDARIFEKLISKANAIGVSFHAKTNIDFEANTDVGISNKDIQTSKGSIDFRAFNETIMSARTNTERHCLGSGQNKKDVYSRVYTNDNASVKVADGVNIKSGNNVNIVARNKKVVRSHVKLSGGGFVVGDPVAIFENNSYDLVHVKKAVISAGKSVKIDATQSSSSSVLRDDNHKTMPIIPDEKTFKTDVRMDGIIKAGLDSQKKLTINYAGGDPNDLSIVYESTGIDVLGLLDDKYMSSVKYTFEDYKELLSEKENTLKEYENRLSACDSDRQIALDNLDDAKLEQRTLSSEAANSQSIIESVEFLKANDDVKSSYEEKIKIDRLTDDFIDFKNSQDKDKFSKSVDNYSNDQLTQLWSAYLNNSSNENYAKVQQYVDLLCAKSYELSKNEKVAMYERSMNTVVVNNIYDVDINNANNLEHFAMEHKNQLVRTNESIAKANGAINKALETIENLDNEMLSIQQKIDNTVAEFDSKLEMMTSALTNAANFESNSSKSIYIAPIVQEVSEVILSSDNITGEGTIYNYPNHMRTVEIVNNTAYDVVFGGIKIKNPLAQNSTTKVDGIKYVEYKNPNEHSNSHIVTITHNAYDDVNSVDKAKFDKIKDIYNSNSDIVIKGDISNLLGTVKLVNNTGNIIQDSRVLAKNISTNASNNKFLLESGFIGDTAGVDVSKTKDGAIIADGNIDISAKTININGLIQSGSDLKELIIDELNIKTGDNKNFIQIIDGVEYKMYPVENMKGYYSVELPANNKAAKIIAYFKPEFDDNGVYLNQGNIYLDNIATGGGNITLSGNIISDNNKGRIVLVDGFGKVNIVNNTQHKLITNIIDTGTTSNAKLTLHDTLIDGSKQNNFGTYEAYIENGVIKTTQTGALDNNGFWSGNDGNRTAVFTPGADSNSVLNQNNIDIQFIGFKTPEVYIASSGSVIINDIINANGGDVIINTADSILSKDSAGIIGDKITLNAQGNIGDINNSINIIALYKGNIEASGLGDMHLNLNTDFEKISLNTKDDIYLKTNSKSFGSTGVIDINSNKLSLVVPEGSVELDTNKNQDISINTNEADILANGDIVFVNLGDIVIDSIKSQTNADVKVTTLNGSILTLLGAKRPIISGKSITLEALNGAIGGDFAVNVSDSSIIKAIARDDVSIYTDGALYIDKIASINGAVKVNSKYSISSILDSEYNIESAGSVDLTSQLGNIANLGIYSNGAVNLSAGYFDCKVGNLNDISVFLMNENGTELGNILASGDVVINSSGSLYQNSGKLIKSDDIRIFTKGDIGSADSFVNVDSNASVTVGIRGGGNVYIANVTDEPIYIDKVYSQNEHEVLNSVHFDSKTGIRNPIKTDEANIRASEIVLNSADNKIGTLYNPFILDLVANKDNQGLSFEAVDAYIDSTNELLHIKSADVADSLVVAAERVLMDKLKLGGTLNISADSAVIYALTDVTLGYIEGMENAFASDILIDSKGSVTGEINNKTYNIYGKNINLIAANSIGQNESPLKILIDSEDNNLNLIAHNLTNAHIVGKPLNIENLYANKLSMYSDSNVYIKNMAVEKGYLGTASGVVDINNLKVSDNFIIDTFNKHVLINNKTIKPLIDGNGVQLMLVLQPTSLRIDENNVHTHIANYISEYGKYNTNYQSIISANQALIKNSVPNKYANSYIKKTVDDSVNSDFGLVRTYKGENVNFSNIIDVINLSIDKSIQYIQDKKDYKTNIIGLKI